MASKGKAITKAGVHRAQRELMRESSMKPKPQGKTKKMWAVIREDEYGWRVHNQYLRPTRASAEKFNLGGEGVEAIVRVSLPSPTRKGRK